MKLMIGMVAILAGIGINVPDLESGWLQKADAPLTNEAKSEAIKAFIKDFKANYVFPELADKTSTVLQEHLDHNDYAQLNTGAEFAKTINGQVHDICQDAHLRFRYSEEVLPVRKTDEQPSADEVKAYNHFVKVSNGGYEHVERLAGNIGYLEVRGFPDVDAAKTLAASSMTFLANTDALILDLRRNGGGDPEAVRILLSYFFDKRTHLNDIYFREGNHTQEFWTSAKMPGKKFLDKDVYVLTSDRTGSGGEECAYDLQCLHRATLIGTSTWGGANPGGVYRLTDHFSAFIPSGRAINPYTKKNWEGTGVIPDIKVEAPKALVLAEKMALEKLLTSATGEDKDRYQRALDDLAKGT